MLKKSQVQSVLTSTWVSQREKATANVSPLCLAFLARGDFHARSRFARSIISEEKWGLLVV